MTHLPQREPQDAGPPASPLTRRRDRTPLCPLRPGDPCSQCQAYATGPQDCGLVYLVMDDPQLRELYVQQVQRRQLRSGMPFPSRA